jgi:hypothetical protein
MLNPDPLSNSPSIETYTGKIYEFLNPSENSICKEDIAHALSHICRFTGHTRDFYSVASHSLLVAALVPDEHKLQALLHDATEAYVGDVSSPLKHLLGTTYTNLEENARRAICEHFHIDFALPNTVKLADRHALYLESKLELQAVNLEYWKQFKDSSRTEAKSLCNMGAKNIEVTKIMYLDALNKWGKK